MARCGCTSTTCSCSVKGGSGVVVTGKGAISNPYLVNIDAGKLTVDQTPTVQLILHGSGTSADWYHLSANATIELDELLDVQANNPAAGQVLAWDGTNKQWKPAPPAVAAPGAISASNGLTGDGSAATPLTAKANQAAGIVVDSNGIGLQSGILAAFKDTGWIESGYVRQSGAATITSFAVRSFGPICEVIVAGTLAAGIPSSTSGDYGNVPLCSVPAAFVPGRFTQALGANASGPSFGFAIGTTGIVTLCSGPPGHAFAAKQVFSVSGFYFKG